MPSEFRVVTDNATQELLESALATVLEHREFQVLLHLGGTPGSRLTQYKRGDDLVSLQSEHESEGRRSFIVHSDQVDLEEVVRGAVELAVTTLLGELLQPLVPGGTVPVPLLHRRVRRLIQDARGGRLSS